MKKKIIAILFIFLIMSAIPLFTTKNMIFKDIRRNYFTVEKKQNNKTESKSNKQVLYYLVTNHYKAEYCDETIKALAIILNTNYKSNPEKYKYNSEYKTSFIKKYSEKRYNKLINLIDSTYDSVITYKDKVVYIPIKYYSTGYTKGNSKYPYIKNSASPWDNIRSQDSVCVSLNGINHLCKKGYNHHQALGWYLNNVKIQNNNSAKE